MPDEHEAKFLEMIRVYVNDCELLAVNLERQWMLNQIHVNRQYDKEKALGLLEDMLKYRMRGSLPGQPPPELASKE